MGAPWRHYGSHSHRPAGVPPTRLQTRAPRQVPGRGKTPAGILSLSQLPPWVGTQVLEPQVGPKPTLPPNLHTQLASSLLPFRILKMAPSAGAYLAGELRTEGTRARARLAHLGAGACPAPLNGQPGSPPGAAQWGWTRKRRGGERWEAALPTSDPGSY